VDAEEALGMGYVVVVVAVTFGVFVYWLLTHRSHHARHGTRRRAVPTSVLGRASLGLLLAGLIVGPISRIEGPVVVTFLNGFAPLGVVAFLASIVAFAKYDDRGLLLLVPFVVGVVLIATPIVFFFAGGST
jgi:hypothetical protein